MVLDANDREVIEAVIDGCRRGDADAFRALFEAYKDRVYSIALRYSGNPAAAMDIAQDTFLKLLSRIGDYRSEASFDSWLYRLVVNSCIDDQRRGRRMTPFLDGLLDAVCAPAESVLAQADARGDRAAHPGRGGEAGAGASDRDRAALHRRPVVRRDREHCRMFAGNRGVAI